MIEIVEGPDYVLEIETSPDTPGWRRRTMTVTQLSGKPLSPCQWHRIAAWCQDVVRAWGGETHSVEFGE